MVLSGDKTLIVGFQRLRLAGLQTSAGGAARRGHGSRGRAPGRQHLCGDVGAFLEMCESSRDEPRDDSGVYGAGWDCRVLVASIAGDAAISPDCRVARQRQRRCEPLGKRGGERSEENTSELQSLMRISYAVSCLQK